MAEYPRYNLTQVFNTRRRLVDQVFLPRFNVSMSGREIESVVSDLQRNLPRGIQRTALFETVRPLVGVELTPAICEQTAWQIAGNISQLREGHAVGPWLGQAQDEWVPLQVLRVSPLRDRFQRIGSSIEFRVLAGSSCPARILRFWKTEMCGPLARRFGFTPPWGQFPYSEAAQFVGLRFLGKIEVAQSREQPVFQEVVCPGPYLKYNRELLKLRFHKIPCPNGWTHPCQQCAVGYEECNAATHLRTYIEGFCPYCELAAPFDPEVPSDRCVPCTIKENLRRKDG